MEFMFPVVILAGLIFDFSLQGEQGVLPWREATSWCWAPGCWWTASIPTRAPLQGLGHCLSGAHRRGAGGAGRGVCQGVPEEPEVRPGRRL